MGVLSLKKRSKLGGQAERDKWERIKAKYRENPSTCNECEKPISYIKRKNKFCSRSCSATYNNKRRKHSEETKKKISKSVKETFIKIDIKSVIDYKKVNGDPDKIVKCKNTWVEKLLNANFDDLYIDSKRRRVIIEQDGKCDNCGIDKWMDEDITLEMDHVDGDRKNNKRDNLVALCPNCHSLTDTWRGRNINGTQEKVTDEELIDAINDADSLHEALRSVGLRWGGGNYYRIKRLMEENEIDLVVPG